MAGVPPHPDAAWWAYMRRGAGTCSGPEGSVILFRAHDIIRLLRTNAIDKSVAHTMASERLSTGSLGLLASCSLTWADGDRHRLLRTAIDSYWSDGRRQTLEESCVGRVAQLASSCDQKALPELVVRVVVARLIAAEEHSYLVSDLIAIAPRVSALQYDSEPLDAANLDGRVGRVLEELATRTASVGSLAEHLRVRTGLSASRR
jgi:hypothetical protein